MNTSDTTMSLESLAFHAQLGSDPSGRSAYFAQGISESVPAHLQRLEKGGGGHHTEYKDFKNTIRPRHSFGRDRFSRYNYENSLSSSVTRDDDGEGSQRLNQGLAQEGNKPQGTNKEVTPVALRTRSCQHQTDSIRIEEDKGDHGNDTNNNC
jgi:hypothetical protein